MPYTFSFRDITRICLALGMQRIGTTSMWRGLGRDRVFRWMVMHSHGQGRPVAPATARAIAKQLRFASVEAMYLFLKELK